MGLFSYYYRVVRRAFSGAWSASQAVLSVLIFAASFLTYWLSLPEGFEPDGWIVTLFVLGGVVTMRLLIAPYWIYRDQQLVILESRKAEALHSEREAAENRRHDERMASEAKTRLVMDGKGWLAKYVKTRHD